MCGRSRSDSIEAGPFLPDLGTNTAQPGQHGASKFGPTSTGVWPTSTSVKQPRPAIGQVWLEPDRFRQSTNPESARCDPNSTSTDPKSDILSRVRPTSARTRSQFGQSWSGIERLGPNSDTVGPVTAKLRPSLTSFDQHGFRRQQLWPEVYQIFPVGQIWATRGGGVVTILELVLSNL